jgi:RES domain-containing protein
MPANALPSTERSGRYFRVYKPDWDLAGLTDPAYSKSVGGRWNQKGEFGAVYLNATVAVAAAQARHQHVGRAIGLFDLRSDRRPALAEVDVPRSLVVDAASAQGLRAMHLPRTYPAQVSWKTCQRIARRAYTEGFAGVAARSNAEARIDYVVGEELAYFDSQPRLRVERAVPFEEWYPDPFPA